MAAALRYAPGITIALTIGVLIVVPTTKAALTVHDCNINGLIFTLPIQDVLPPCENITETKTISGRLVHRPGPQTVIGLRCLVEHIEKNNPTGSSPKTKTLTKEECLEAHRTKTLEIEGSKVKVKSYTTFVVVPNKQTSTGSDELYAITLSEHTGKVNVQHDIVSFNDLSIDCDFSNFSCQDDQVGQMFWTSELNSELEHIIFSGQITLFSKGRSHYWSLIDRDPFTRFVGPDQNVFYAVMEGISRIIAVQVHPLNGFESGESVKNAFRADEPDWFIDVTDNVEKFWRFSPYKKAKNIRSELALRPGKGKKYEEKTKMDVVRNWCVQERGVVNYLLNSKIWEVDDFFELPLRGRFGVTDINGDIQTKICPWSNQVTIRRDADNRAKNECYDSNEIIPVVHPTKGDMFMRPASRLLLDYYEPTPCTSLKKLVLF